jgi:hypothetical protein
LLPLIKLLQLLLPFVLVVVGAGFVILALACVFAAHIVNVRCESN